MDIAKIKKFSVEHPKIIAYYLFGSTAMDRKRKGSDIDIAIMVSNPVGGMERIQLETGLSNLLGGDVDLVIFSQVSPLLQHQILKYGHMLHETEPKERIRQEVAARSNYLDTKHLHKEIRSVNHG